LGHVVGTWAEVEARLISILTAFMGASSGVAIAMLQQLRSSSAQIDQIEAAGGVVLKGSPYLKLFEAIMWIAGRLGKERNFLVHNVFAHSPELPDALLVVEIEAAVGVMVNSERLTRERIELPPPPTLHPELRFDPAAVWVYRKQDFGSLLRDLYRLRACITLFHQILKNEYARPAILDLLDREPLIQDALRVLASRDRNPPPSRPQDRGG
jgi:hypothetical protein